MQSSSAHLLIEVKNTNSLVPKFSSDSYLITLDVDAILHTSLLDLQVHNLNLYNSTILSQFQADSLIKLCDFGETEIKFELIYRASVDGFGANDFHRQCDGISKTLTIIKVKGNSIVFGGYTDVAWDSSNNFKEDHNAFIFSLVNKENKPVKIPIKKNDFADAIYCSSCCGPAFGFRDIQIACDSNRNNNSYSHLGYNFTHPEFASHSKKSRSFLARTLYFTTQEIEVYRMVIV